MTLVTDVDAVSDGSTPQATGPLGLGPAALELVESALGCSLSVFECLRFAMRDQFLVARWAEQFPANDGAAGAIGRKIEHHQFVIANEARTAWFAPMNPGSVCQVTSFMAAS